MNLRKACFLKGLPQSFRTTFPRDDLDQISFACEIALERMRKQGRTLDQVLCNPSEAAQFDQAVRSIVSRDVSSLKLRWVAFSIRKRAHARREYARQLPALLRLPKQIESMAALDLSQVPERPGLYWLGTVGNNLYVGETLNLRRRFELQFESGTFDFWNQDRESIEVRFGELPETDKELKGNQSHWIKEWKPVGNFAEFAAL
jgi:hypothetical protein